MNFATSEKLMLGTALKYYNCCVFSVYLKDADLFPNYFLLLTLCTGTNEEPLQPTVIVSNGDKSVYAINEFAINTLMFHFQRSNPVLVWFY